MNRKNKNKTTANIDNEKKQHVVLPEVEVKHVSEPKPICSICGETIDSIIEAIRESDGSFSHFDCVLKKLSEEYHVTEPDKVSYVGGGSFAVVSFNQETGNFDFKEKINYESNETFAEMKKFVEDNKK